MHPMLFPTDDELAEMRRQQRLTADLLRNSALAPKMGEELTVEDLAADPILELECREAADMLLSKHRDYLVELRREQRARIVMQAARGMQRPPWAEAASRSLEEQAARTLAVEVDHSDMERQRDLRDAVALIDAASDLQILALE